MDFLRNLPVDISFSFFTMKKRLEIIKSERFGKDRYFLY
ncbi:hypothetical protein BSM4216_0719 [Bacillus smithii]|nr:hypothetical protein BSM4216_0719 [Bacillus smithii]